MSKEVLWILAFILAKSDGLKLKCFNDGFVS